MMRFLSVTLSLVICISCHTPTVGQKPPEKPKAKVELRWVESKRIEGVTEDKGFQCSCAPDDIVYAHKKPALVLTAAEVVGPSLTVYDFSKSGLSSENCVVKLPLTKKARETLAASCKGNEMRLLTVVVDGRYWGVRRYEIDKNKKFVPEECRAETFTPEVGFIPSKAEAQRIVDALK